MSTEILVDTDRLRTQQEKLQRARSLASRLSDCVAAAQGMDLSGHWRYAEISRTARQLKGQIKAMDESLVQISDIFDGLDRQLSGMMADYMHMGTEP